MSDLTAAWSEFEKTIAPPAESSPADQASPQALNPEITAEAISAGSGDEGLIEATEQVADKPAQVAVEPEPLRDEKGRFIPLNRHEDILSRQRNETAAERALRASAETRISELEKKLAQFESGPGTIQNEAEFEEQIKDLPEGLQEQQRKLRASNIALESRIAATEAELQKARVAEQAIKEQVEHEATLSTVPILAEAYKDDFKRAAIDLISDTLMASSGYKYESRAQHYAEVQSKYVQMFGAPAKAAQPTPSPKPLPALSSAPASLSAIKSGAPPSAAGNPVESMSLFEAIAATRKMTPDQRQAAFFKPTG